MEHLGSLLRNCAKFEEEGLTKQQLLSGFLAKLCHPKEIFESKKLKALIAPRILEPNTQIGHTPTDMPHTPAPPNAS